ncbi:MAG TPA: SDR family oxidoreductase [Conexivisphaerales archaeon]|nr:SDR family oxidoreductase [Conexivisphaerales archaeon]
MEGRVCMVTGATSGIGRATAEALSRMGAALVLVGRSREKSEETIMFIKESTGNSKVEYLLADLSSQKEIRSLVEKFKSNHSSLHVLVNNAGATFSKRRETVDGFEMTWATNYLSCFLLTNLLLDLLKSSAPSRIVNVSSGLHRRARLDFNDLQLKAGYSRDRAYDLSKLAMVLFTYELARRLEGSRVTANALGPGLVRTNLGKNEDLATKLAKSFADLFAASAEEGARTSVYLASSPEVEGVTGMYFLKGREARSSDLSYNSEFAKRLWEISEAQTGLKR